MSRADVIKLDTIPEGEEAAHSIDFQVDVELEPAEVAAIADAALAEYSLLMVEREVQPHVVHGYYKVKDGIHVGPVTCPDCTRGLVSRGTDMVCWQVPARTPLKGTKLGDIIACGRPR